MVMVIVGTPVKVVGGGPVVGNAGEWAAFMMTTNGGAGIRQGDGGFFFAWRVTSGSRGEKGSHLEVEA
jgi:hypothetical protein